MRRAWMMTTIYAAGFVYAAGAKAKTDTPAQTVPPTKAVAHARATRQVRPVTPATEAAPPKFEEVIVTAQKRSQKVNDVGMAITAAGSATLKARDIATVSDLTRIEPSFQAQTSENDTPVYTIRGVGYFDQSLAATPTVSIYEGEIPFPLSPMGQGVLLDPERVEILKGPQGTLFGQNATGGAINFVSAKPTSVFAAGIDASVERFGEYKLDGFVSGPLTPTLTARLSASVDEGGDWQDSRTRSATLGNKDNQFARLLLNWTPTDNVQVNVNLNGWRNDSDNQAPQLEGVWFNSPNLISPDKLTPASANFRPNAAYSNTYPPAIQALVQQPTSPTNAQQADWAPGTDPSNGEYFYQDAVRVDYEPSDKVKLTSLSSYEAFDERNTVDQGGVGFPYSEGTINGEAFSLFQELRASGHLFRNRGSWIFGANYQDDGNHEQDYFSPIFVSPVYNTGGSLFSPVQDAPFQFGARNNVDSHTGSVFVHADYPVLSTVTLNGGIRFTESDQNMVGCSFGNAAGAVFINEIAGQLSQLFHGRTPTPVSANQCDTIGPPASFQPGPVYNKLDQSNVPWRAGVEWRPRPNTLLYFDVSRGYKAGTSPALVGTSYTEYRPVTQESLLSYELGEKVTLLDGSVQVNGALFHYDYTNKQELGRVIDPLGVFGALETLVNIPKSKEDGAELAIAWRPISGLTLNGSMTYIDSQVTSNFINYSPYVLSAADTVNFKGESFPFTPKWSLQFGGRYEWELARKLLAYVGVDGSYQSDTTAAFGASHAYDIGAPSLGIRAYPLLNLAVGVESRDRKWLVELYGRNVTNTYYWTTAYWVGDTTLRDAGLPAIYGIRLSYKF